MGRQRKVKPKAGQSRDKQLNIRVLDERLPAAIQRYAKATRRSANLAMNYLLENALAKEGFWPPANEG